MITPARLREIEQVMRAAGRAEIMPRFRKLAAGDVRAKSGPLDLVTEADERAEAMITAALRQRFPEALIVGEEASAADAALPRRLADAPLAFVLDPVDGTANFVAGLPLFGVMVAVVEAGEVVAGLIHDPVGDDTAVALRGEGAWIETPGGQARALRVAEPVPVGAMTGSASWRNLPGAMRQRALAGLDHFAGTWNYRTAAHEYRTLASGYSHFALFGRLMPWDHLAGWLLHREAGGYAARLDGSEYRPGMMDGGLLCAPDRDCWEAVRDALLGAI